MRTRYVLLVGSGLTGACDWAQKINRSLFHIESALDRETAETKLKELNCLAVIASLDHLSVSDIRYFVQTYAVTVVCVQRVPTEENWIDVLAAGATEYCAQDDYVSVQRALRVAVTRHSACSAAVA